MATFDRNRIDGADAQEQTYDSYNATHVNDSVLVEDQTFISRPPSPILEQALTKYVPNISPNTIEQQRTEDSVENLNLLNVLSRVTIAIAKYPNDATLHNYSALQMWMYMHANKHAPADICESLGRMFLIHTNHYDYQILLNLYLICAEAYQTIGQDHQAYCQYDQAKKIAKILDNTTIIMTDHGIMESDRIRKKLEDVGMKLEFQSEFKYNLIKCQRLISASGNFLKQLNMDNPSRQECRRIWRQIVLQTVLDPSIIIPGAQWLLSYADSIQPSDLQHANSLYVALNLFLLGYGSNIFQGHLNIDVFKMLDNISRYFVENGNQSKQFSPIHKMAHIWGTAAVAFHLLPDRNKYLVCASMMRVSFESLGICFLSSGIESLYILVRTQAPDFFTMMATDPSVKLISPECINYFRRKLETNSTCIQYSSEAVDQFVSDIFNIDQTDYRI